MAALAVIIAAVGACCLCGSAEAASDRARKPPRAPAPDKPAPGKQPAEAAPQQQPRGGTLGPTCASWVPFAPGVDQSPSDPAQYGKCTSSVDAHIVGPSNWCQFGRLGQWPAGPSRKAQQCLKNGRMTVYRGPVLGSEPNHKGACAGELSFCCCCFAHAVSLNQRQRKRGREASSGCTRNKLNTNTKTPSIQTNNETVDLEGTNDTAIVAVSTKYLKTSQHGWVDDHGSCGKCMCIHVRGVDNEYNPGAKYYAAKQYFGLTFLGKVGDRCGECEDEHIDVLLDRPLAYAPYDPAAPRENANAVYANSKPGPRGFSDPKAMRGGDFAPETAGTWVADWQWVPCQGWSHLKCAMMMRGAGYKRVFTPADTPGVDSNTLKRVSKVIGSRPWGTASVEEEQQQQQQQQQQEQQASEAETEAVAAETEGAAPAPATDAAPPAAGDAGQAPQAPAGAAPPSAFDATADADDIDEPAAAAPAINAAPDAGAAAEADVDMPPASPPAADIDASRPVADLDAPPPATTTAPGAPAAGNAAAAPAAGVTPKAPRARRQRRRASAAPAPLPVVAAYQMCGGKGDGCRAAATRSSHRCRDAQWAKCADAGFRCQRQDEYYWSCTDAAPRPS